MFSISTLGTNLIIPEIYFDFFSIFYAPFILNSKEHTLLIKLGPELPFSLSSYDFPSYIKTYIYKNKTIQQFYKTILINHLANLVLNQIQILQNTSSIQQNQLSIKLLMGKGKLILTNQDPQIQEEKHELHQTKKIKKKNKNKHNSNLIEQIQPHRVDQSNHSQHNSQQQQNQNNKQINEELADNQIEQQHQETKQKIKLKHLAIALPDSILQLPQTSQLRAYFISEVARISSIFKVDEIIVLKDHSYVSKSQAFNPAEYMARNLQYLETPQYLRKHLFKLHADLKNAGLMNPIECHHHLLTTQPSEFRQGVALDRPVKKGSGSWVDIGLKREARMDQLVLPLTRVTLKLKNYDDPDAPFYQAQAVSKRVPRAQHGLYWGYDVRIAKNLPDMFNASKNFLGQEQYNIKLLCNHTKETYNLPQIEHFYQIEDQLQDSSVLIFFSGTDDLEAFVEKDAKSKISKHDAINMFDCCMRFEGCGVKKLRIQEQLFITLSKICQYTY